MGILNGKIKPLNGKEHATKEHERRKRDYIRYSQKLVKEAFGENYPVLGKKY